MTILAHDSFIDLLGKVDPEEFGNHVTNKLKRSDRSDLRSKLESLLAAIPIEPKSDDAEDESEEEDTYIDVKANGPSKVRALFDQTLSKVSRRAGASRDALVEKFKSALSSQLSLNEE